MNINQMRYFVVLVEKHSFTTAARECMITQSALSQQMKNLEQSLQVSLFVRNGRNFELTPAGKLLYQRLVPLLQNFTDLCYQVAHVGQNTGSTLRLGLPSSMDHHQLAPKLTELVLNQTGLELSLFYGCHDELYERFGSGGLHAFISDESRLTLRDSYHKLPLFAAKMYVEFPQSKVIAHQGIKKFKLAASQLEELRLGYVCNKDYLEEEQRFLENLLQVPLHLYAVPDMAAGRKALLSTKAPFNAMLFTRSLLKGDYEFKEELVRYELLNQGETVKRQLSCYAKLHMHTLDLNELCQIICTLGCKQAKETLDELNRIDETPVRRLRAAHQTSTMEFTAERVAL